MNYSEIQTNNKSSLALQVFTYEQKRDVRTIKVDDEIWFVAKDVCDVLGLADVTSALRTLDDDEILIRKVCGIGSNRGVNLISESGLYTLIIRSYKPEAKRFRRWVTHEVIPSIRQTGKYEMPKPQRTPQMLPEKPIEINSVVKSFEFDGHKIRYFEHNGEIYFCSLDITRACNYQHFSQHVHLRVRTNPHIKMLYASLKGRHLMILTKFVRPDNSFLQCVNYEGLLTLLKRTRNEKGFELGRMLLNEFDRQEEQPQLQQQQQEQQRKTPFNMSYWSLFLERVTAVMNRGDKKEIEFVKKMLFAASTILSMV
ncbi:MAG: Bro-N domain-containing protein [Synergistaceae bacterium]|nr:Bro-N domain-containing protein [Synergistaceae bacterium]